MLTLMVQAEPNPCKIREATNISKEVEQAHNTDETMKMDTPVKKTLR